MSFYSELRERRLFQIVATTAAAGWVVLEGLGSLIERGMLPEMLYPVALVWYLGGLAAATVIGWYHGEKGEQEWTPTELVLVGVIAVGVLGFTGLRIVDYRQERAVARAIEGGIPLTRVAVLYFDDGSAADTATYLGDALTEALIDQLRSVDGLDVVSANAVLPFRGEGVSADSVGSALGVGTVVDGTVEQVGDEIRVSVRLLEGSSGVEMARASLERPADEAIAATGEVAAAVAELFRERLGEEVRLREVSTGTRNVHAWRAVQQAEKLRKDAERAARSGSGSVSELVEDADGYVTVAQGLDPDWVEPRLVRARLALDHLQRLREPAAAREWLDRGVEAADAVLEEEPGNARALELRGTLRLYAHIVRLARDLQEHEAFLREAKSDLEQAVRRDRSLAGAFAALSVLYYQPGLSDLPAASLAARQAYEADAYLRTADDVLERLFWTNLDMGQFSQARSWCDEGRRRFPDDPRFQVCRLWLMTSPGADPDTDEGWEVQRRLGEMSGEERSDIRDVRGRMLMAAALGRAAEAAASEAQRGLLADSARAVLEAAHDDYQRLDDPHRELFAVEAFAWVILDDFDAAIDRWKTYASLNHGFQDSGDISWRWQELRSHPRFSEVVTQEGAHP